MTKSHRVGLTLLVLMIGANFLPFSWLARTKRLSGSPGNQDAPVKAVRGRAAFFVSPRGNDGWSGKLDHPNAAHSDGPFRTPLRARDAIRRLKASGSLTGPVTVYLRGGVYELHEPLVFTPEDSGSPKAPIAYKAYPGEIPILSGGRAITGWVRFSGGASRSPAGSHLWVADVPGVKKGQSHFHQFFVEESGGLAPDRPIKGSTM